MSFQIKFTIEAEETYDAVTEQLRQRWGERFVIKFQNKVSKCIDTITITPYLYPIANENSEIRKCILHENCSMFYRIYDDSIFILWFWDNRQDPLIIF
jgi:hypothetical protein